MSSPKTGIVFTPIPIIGTMGCSIPVKPGTPDADGELDERTEVCARDANWLVGACPTCDVHVKVVCEMTGIDWPELVEEAGRDLAHAERPWSERQQHSQEDTRATLKHFAEGLT